jgi:hypothetical protein
MELIVYCPSRHEITLFVIDRANKFFGIMPIIPGASEMDSADYVMSDDAS